MNEFSPNENQNLVIDFESKDFLKETAKWTYFLSILGFVGIGILVLVGFFIQSIFAKLGSISGGMMGNQMGGGFIGSFYIIMAVIYFFPVYYMFKFSTKIKSALKLGDSLELKNAFRFLKSHFKFVGILCLIFTVLYVVILVIALSFGALAFLS
ncbi:DUF5362 family protein [Flavobacterium algicola]|uniref:DUF5362 family protein n=1 Tax=Flavobacterium algicola TaxID=556529 RepID=UPI001EFE3A11|nr:DUF5362 family protein [Flavobacterium algicola]MCG9792736.1 DUF5362 family protein [Flavobacterium algicola]